MAFVAAAAPLLAVAGAGMSAYGAVQGGMAQKDAMNYRAQVAENNKIIAEQNAEASIKAGMAKASTQAMKGAAAGGKIKAAQAASGVDVNTGSFVDVQEGQREAALLDVETVMHNADLQAYGYRTQAKNFEAEAHLDRAAGKQAEKAGWIKGASSLLGGASSLGFKWTGDTGASGFTGELPAGLPEDI